MIPVVSLVAVFRAAAVEKRDVILVHVEARRCLDVARVFHDHVRGELVSIALVLRSREVVELPRSEDGLVPSPGVEIVYDAIEIPWIFAEWRWKHPPRIERGTVRQRKARERAKLAERRAAR